jgi:hypothetical protein
MRFRATDRLACDYVRIIMMRVTEVGSRRSDSGDLGGLLYAAPIEHDDTGLQ